MGTELDIESSWTELMLIGRPAIMQQEIEKFLVIMQQRIVMGFWRKKRWLKEGALSLVAVARVLREKWSVGSLEWGVSEKKKLFY